MKSYGHLYEQFLSVGNYELAVRNATKHKGGKKRRRKNRRARYIRDHMAELMPRFMEYAGNFHPTPHVPVEIYDGIRRKKRMIVVPSMREQVVHHMLINILKPIFMGPMYEHSYGSIPDRGAHAGKRQLEKWIRNGGRECKYVLKMDVRKFFDSVPHDRLRTMLSSVIRDSRLMRVIDAVIDSADGDKGIPIGFYTSQWFANFYLTGLDHYVKEELGVRYYMRYMDDMVIFGPSKRKLHSLRRDIERYLNEVLGLDMKDDWQVFLFDYVKPNGKRVGRNLDFMEFQFFRDHTVLRKSIMMKCTRKARRISRKARNGRPKTIYDVRQMLAYLGWIDATKTYGMYKKHVKPFVSFGALKRYASRYQIRMNLEELCGT